MILNQPFMGGQDAHPTRKLILCETGILPVLKQENPFFVEQASCLFLNKKIHSLWNRHLACSQARKSTLCGTGILPVLENSLIHIN